MGSRLNLAQESSTHAQLSSIRRHLVYGTVGSQNNNKRHEESV